MKSGIILFLFLLLSVSCSNPKNRQKVEATDATYTNPLWNEAADFSATYYDGKYYFLQSRNNKIILRKTDDMTDLNNAVEKEVWVPTDKSNSFNLWRPELHRVNGKWYIYYAADDGNTDDHQLYVIENESSNPMRGDFVMKGPIMTNPEWNWGIHVTTFMHKGEQYLLWSGWPRRRINIETQCIYIAKMKNPWTLESPRILISRPQYEWERQWVNPDGSRTAYPIHVNESPQAFYSKDSTKVFVFYSASGCWTPYYSLGLLVADADSDLLNPSSWTKSPEPVFSSSSENKVYGPGSVSFLPSPDLQEIYMLYHARNDQNGSSFRTIRLQKIQWGTDGMPLFGAPVPVGVSLPKPSGTLEN